MYIFLWQIAQMDKHSRLREARIAAGFKSSADAARSLGVSPPTYAHHENGTRGFRDDAARLYARRFKVSVEWLLFGNGDMSSSNAEDSSILLFPQKTEAVQHEPNAIISNEPPVEFTRVPVYGQAIGGEDGYFVLNGSHIDDILAPPILTGVKNAYAVYVAGESMEPRYFAGEAVFVHPRLPVARGDFVVAQIKRNGDIHGYVKRLVKMTEDKIILGQFNPSKELEFSRDQVISIHKIVASGI